MTLRFAMRFLQYAAAGRMGDAAAMKAAAFGARAYPQIAARLRALDDPFPAIDIETLKAGPAESFGWHYATFMEIHGLRPFSVSPEAAAELWPDHVLEVRYPLLHDAFHVLLGFDITLPGELGVWSFVAAQHYSPGFDRAGRLGGRLYPLVAPRQRAALRAAAARGQNLAAQVACLIAEPLDRYFAEPLDAVRARLGLAGGAHDLLIV